MNGSASAVRPRWAVRAGAIYAIADVDALHPLPAPAAVAEMAAAGIRSIQLRAKKLPGDELYRVAEGCCEALAGSGAELWIDDRADVAALLPVAGLHLGQTDLPPSAARRVLGGAVWIGLSSHGKKQVIAADAEPEVDVIAVGPIFPTTGKERPGPAVGLALLRWARVRTRKPLIAIGGIDADNVAAVLAAGADRAAVLGAVCRGAVGENCRRLLAAVA
ncbi:MAG: thiamine phosphate synthase [Acidobacteriota bacterium]|nr:thiamine phosphate synthase [Acidobacteriota bacterium]